MKRVPISLAALLVLMMPIVRAAGPRAYQIKQITTDALNHESPSINTHGDIVWSQQVGGFWQVYIRHFGSTTDVALPGQVPDHNNQYPDIDDAGNVVYLKDGVGQGVALAVILNHGGTESIIQFSSINVLSGQERRAGKHFGIAGNGTAITYFDFLTFGFGPRTFVVSGVGNLAPDFSTVQADDPDINSNGTFVYSALGSIFSAPVSAPNSATNMGSGSRPRIADVVPPATAAEIVYISGSTQVVSTIGGIIDAGSWADVNNGGNIVYEKAVGGLNQIFLASTGCQSNKPCITNPQDGASPQSQFVAITGTGQPGATLDVLVSGVSSGTVTVDSEGNWDALPNIYSFATAIVSIQVEDIATTDMSNTISVNNAIGPFVPPPPVPASFLPLRHGDILISSNPTSLERPLWGATWTHSAVFLGGDANGTPQVAEAVITSHSAFSGCTTNPGALQCGVTRIVTLEGSDLWDGTTRIAAFTPRNPLFLTAAQRGGIVAYASGKSGVPYWNYAQTFGPIGGAYALWPLFSGTARFTALLNQMNANKNLDTAFECATFVWRAYLEGTSHLVDISNPNNMTAQPGSIFSFLLGPGGGAFLDQIRPVWVVPETFATSPNLQQIF